MAVKIFFCYAHEDEQLLNKLKTQLTPLRHQHFIEIWHDRDISAGTEWEKEISKHLNTAKIILLLVSPNFMASDYCYSVEMKRALERHERGEAVVIPIILRPVFWQSVLGKLQALPKDAIPMKKWPDLDDAFFDVEEGIRKVIKVLLLNEGEDNFKAHSYLEALTAFEQVIQLDPKNATAYHGMGNALHALNQPEEALSAYEKAIKIDPNYAVAWCGKGNILCDLKRYEEALIGFERSIQLDHKLACGYIGKGNSLRNLNRNQEALTTYEQAIKLAHNDANLHNSKGEILRDLNRNEEALASFEQATQIAPENVHFNTNRIDISYDLRLSAAEAALKQVVERDIARKQMRHELGASQNTGRLSIEQLWYTWSNSGFGVTTGFRVRAASQGLADMNSKIINALTPHLQYRLPHGIYDIDPKEAPICLSLIETEQEHILVNKVYTGYDDYRRPGAFFTHLLAGLPKEFSAREAIALWKSSFWYSSDATLPRTMLELPTVLLSDLYPGPLVTTDVRKVEEYLPFVIQAFLSLEQKQKIYIAAPSDTVAILIWGLTQCIPRSLIERLTFSTYEYDVSQSSGLIIGTSWFTNPPLNNRENAQQDLPAFCYDEGLAINCYSDSGKYSKLDPDTLVASYARYATKSLVSAQMIRLHELLRKAERMAIEDIGDFELLVKIVMG